MLLADQSWDQVQEYLSRDDRLILPLGATEQHGRHLGLGCDYQIAETLATATGERAGIMVAPPIAYGMSHHHFKFSGTLSLKPTTLIAVVEDVLRSAVRHGFRRVLVVNGHGGNEAAISSALAVITDETPELRVKEFTWWTEPEILKMVDEYAGPQRGTHSSPAETAFLLAARPQAVHMERAAKRDAPVARDREFMSNRVFAERYPDGVMGLDPTPGTKELGQKLFERCLEMCLQEVNNW